jgi:hypothetical protein
MVAAPRRSTRRLWGSGLRASPLDLSTKPVQKNVAAVRKKTAAGPGRTMPHSVAVNFFRTGSV